MNTTLHADLTLCASYIRYSIIKAFDNGFVQYFRILRSTRKKLVLARKEDISYRLTKRLDER